MTYIVPGYQPPFGIEIFERVKARMMLLEAFPTARRHLENKLQEPAENAGVGDNGNGLVGMCLCDGCKCANAAIETLPGRFTFRNDIPEPEPIIRFPLFRKLVAQFFAVPPFRLLEMFKASHTRIALVVDEYGAVEGLVTLNDFFEDLVGEVASGPMPQKRFAVQRSDGSWLVDGKMPVHDFKELMNLPKLPDEEKRGYHTLGGFVMLQIGRVPVATDSFEARGLRFEVIDMDENRVDKVLVQRKNGVVT
jgi:Transporter associated domain